MTPACAIISKAIRFCFTHSILCASLSLLSLLGCSPVSIPSPEWQGAEWIKEPSLIQGFLRTSDGAELPFQKWLPEQPKNLKTLIIGVHGFNDYSGAFSHLGPKWIKQGIGLYAYDQRGFGAAPYRGYAPEPQRLSHDLKDMVLALRLQHPLIPIYLMGMSMGGAVTLNTLSQNPKLPIEGAILVAPAVWGRKFMPVYQQMALWLGAYSLPWVRLTGRGLKIKPSDNIKMLIKMARDPQTIKATRIDALWGLVNVMDAALLSGKQQQKPLLFLYGQKDELVPKEPTLAFLKTLPDTLPVKLAVYEQGYHMLLRDIGSDIVQKDIFQWIKNRTLTSVADQNALQRLQEALN